MKKTQIISQVKDMFLATQFEFCQESIGDDYCNISFIYRDFRVEISFDFKDNEIVFFLDRPSFGFNDSKVVKSLEEIKRHWNKMTSLLKGKFNPFYSVTAKDNSWVDSKKYAFYFLTSDWKEIFRKK